MRERRLRKRKNNPGVFVPKCKSNGHFRVLQCNRKTKACWCVDRQGKQIQGTRIRGGGKPKCRTSTGQITGLLSEIRIICSILLIFFCSTFALGWYTRQKTNLPLPHPVPCFGPNFALGETSSGFFLAVCMNTEFPAPL